MRLLSILFICFVLAGCSSQQNEVATNQNQTINNSSTSENIDQEVQSELATITIDIPGQSPLQAPVNEIPELQAYIDQSSDPEVELERILTKYLFQNDTKDYILVSYGCGVKLCTNLFLEHDNGKFRSLTVSETSFYQQHQQSDSYVAIRFGQNESNEVVRNQLAVINLSNWKQITPPSELAFLSQFEYPIIDMKLAGGSLVLSVADVPDTSYETLADWFNQNERSVREIEWILK